MEKSELFRMIEPLLEKLKDHQRTGTIIFKDIDQKLSIKTVYREIHPGVNVELSCDSCVLHTLNLLLAWYEREYPKYQRSIQQPLKAESAPIEAVSVEEPAPVITKRKRKKK